jgi:protein-S-isoprenylcysteine O-methyltransferase Ste14
MTSLFFLAADVYFPAWMPDGEIVVLAIGFLVLSRFFSQRQRYHERYGLHAFYQAFTRINVWGLGIVGASIGHLGFISGPRIPDVWWRGWLIAVGFFLVLAGILLWLRAVQSAGMDSLMMLYVYWPRDGALIESGLYGMLRHPIYSAALHIGLGLAMIHASWYALIVAVLLPIFFFGWVRLVEERDLIQRFQGYEEYRRRVPAFLPRLENEIRLWRLLITGK